MNKQREVLGFNTEALETVCLFVYFLPSTIQFIHCRDETAKSLALNIRLGTAFALGRNKGTNTTLKYEYGGIW